MINLVYMYYGCWMSIIKRHGKQGCLKQGFQEMAFLLCKQNKTKQQQFFFKIIIQPAT